MEAVGNLRAEEILEALDNEQRAVALATRGPVCVIAGAGTGKTRAITHRIAYAAAIGTMDPHKVLALTFTARAAGEMRTRLRSLGVPAVAARTIHAAALKQLTFFWPQVFGGRTPDLLTTKSGFLSEAIKRAQLQGELSITSRDLLRDIATEIEWAKVSQISPSDYLSESLKRTVKPRINPEQLAKVYTAYESVKHQERAIDFEDVLLLTTAMIEEEREVRERVQDQYRFFTVDEYQDISPLQQRLINAWLGSRQELCVVGDPAQTIYSFAGATPVFLNSFTQRFPEAEVVRLTTGYRSTPEIIFTANSILRKGAMGNELVAINDHGSKPTITAYNDESAEIAGIVRDAIVRRMARTSDASILGTGQTAPFTELEELAGGHTSNSVTTGSTTDMFVKAELHTARSNMGVWGMNPSDLVCFLSQAAYYSLLTDSDVTTVDKYGENAVIKSGELGKLYGISLIVSDAFEAAAASKAVGILVNPSNYLIGNHRGLTLEMATDVVAQQRAMVATRRFGFIAKEAGAAGKASMALIKTAAS